MAGSYSRNKGKRGEREAVNYLKSLGHEDAERTAQHSGKGGTADVQCLRSLPNVHIEVKYGYSRNDLDVGSSLLSDAYEQAWTQRGDKNPCVLWRPKGHRNWRLSFHVGTKRLDGMLVTVSGDADIGCALDDLNEQSV